MPKADWEKRILLGITGKGNDWERKLNDLKGLRVETAALFLERFDQGQRKRIYRALLDTTLSALPLVHIKNDMEIEELVFLESKFKSRYFTIHENSFSFLDKWPGFEKKLYLEMNYDNFVSQKVMVGRIGGFCVDLSHFKAAQTKFTKDFEYVYYKNGKANFPCNHLNGYDPKRNSDTHIVKSLKSFDYLRTLPRFLFGSVIGLETDNEIPEQLKFKNYLVKFLENTFNGKK